MCRWLTILFAFFVAVLLAFPTGSTAPEAEAAVARPAIATGEAHTCSLRASGVVRCWGENSSGAVGDGTVTDRTVPTAVSGLSDAKAIAAGGGTSCAILGDGTVRCWGSDSDGQLGNGAPLTNSSTPVTVTGLTSVVQLDVGSNHVCAVTAAGSLYCWGDNSDGQLGNGGFVDASTPVLIGSGINAIQVVAGFDHTCMLLVDGTVKCWGDNTVGQLGIGSFSAGTPSIPASAIAGLTDVTALTAGFSHTCASHRADGLSCWGENGSGQLGDGTTTDRNVPTGTVGVQGQEAAMSGGGSHTCNVQFTFAYCWGSDAMGELGNGADPSSTSPDQIVTLTTAVAIAAGGNHSCALLYDGTEKCWGLNSSGQVGDGTITNRTSPVTVFGLMYLAAPAALDLNGAHDIVAGESHACALLANGEVRCWGANADGQLGDGTTTLRNTPAPVCLSGSGAACPRVIDATNISAGKNHTCVVRLNGTVLCWGANAQGQLGDGTTTDRPNPVQVCQTTCGFLLGSVTNVSAGGSDATDAHTCAVTSVHSAACWGDNSFGQLGDGTTIDRLLAVTVCVSGSGSGCPNLSNVNDVAAGATFSCAVMGNGGIKCWGENGSGQLGDGLLVDRTLPGNVCAGSSGPACPPVATAASIDAGDDHACMVSPVLGGSVFCWGVNFAGQIGDGTTTSRTLPTFASAAAAHEVAAGGNHTCMVVASGAVSCWGDNPNGQVGDGTTTDKLSPTTVTGLTNTRAIAAGVTLSCALKSDLTTQCWGSNVAGQIGDGTFTNRLTPSETGLDTDGDGCADFEEYGAAPALGGLRDPLNRWDFYDVNANKIVNAVDTGLVRAKFLVVPGPSEIIYDRSNGVATYASGPPNNIINAVDIGLVRAQFNHSCTAAP
jgi:alpha-tubulin suppressor-like RCC1 family protein